MLIEYNLEIATSRDRITAAVASDTTAAAATATAVAASSTTPNRESTGIRSSKLFPAPTTCDVTHLEHRGPLLKVLSEQLLGHEVREPALLGSSRAKSNVDN